MDLNTDRVCENCYRDWRGGAECPMCGHVTPPEIVAICAWCPDAAERTAAARAHGYDVSHTMCEPCAVRWLAEATEAAS
jgi:hypothetical protein